MGIIRGRFYIGIHIGGMRGARVGAMAFCFPSLTIILCRHFRARFMLYSHTFESINVIWDTLARFYTLRIHHYNIYYIHIQEAVLVVLYDLMRPKRLRKNIEFQIVYICTRLPCIHSLMSKLFHA